MTLVRGVITWLLLWRSHDRSHDMPVVRGVIIRSSYDFSCHYDHHITSLVTISRSHTRAHAHTHTRIHTHTHTHTPTHTHTHTYAGHM